MTKIPRSIAALTQPTSPKRNQRGIAAIIARPPA
jgi:hypothetical protein